MYTYAAGRMDEQFLILIKRREGKCRIYRSSMKKILSSVSFLLSQWVSIKKGEKIQYGEREG